MSDIVDRLRENYPQHMQEFQSGEVIRVYEEERQEAADTMAALRAELHDMKMVADHHSEQSMHWAAEAEKLAQGIAELKAENARLREIMRGVDKRMWPMVDAELRAALGKKGE